MKENALKTSKVFRKTPNMYAKHPTASQVGEASSARRELSSSSIGLSSGISKILHSELSLLSGTEALTEDFVAERINCAVFRWRIVFFCNSMKTLKRTRSVKTMQPITIPAIAPALSLGSS